MEGSVLTYLPTYPTFLFLPGSSPRENRERGKDKVKEREGGAGRGGGRVNAQSKGQGREGSCVQGPDSGGVADRVCTLSGSRPGISREKATTTAWQSQTSAVHRVTT